MGTDFVTLPQAQYRCPLGEFLLPFLVFPSPAPALSAGSWRPHLHLPTEKETLACAGSHPEQSAASGALLRDGGGAVSQE